MFKPVPPALAAPATSLLIRNWDEPVFDLLSFSLLSAGIFKLEAVSAGGGGAGFGAAGVGVLGFPPKSPPILLSPCID
jgi:hypothetical protein